MARERRAAFVGSFLALCLGVAILTVGALTLLSPGGGVPERYQGAPVLVRSTQDAAEARANGRFLEAAPFSPRRTAELTRQLAQLPGVRDAVPDRAFAAQAVVAGKVVGDQERGERQGHGWSSAALAPYGLSDGHPPRRDDEVAVDGSLGLRPGDRVRLRTATGSAPYTVSGTVAGPGYYVSDERAAQLAGGVRVIGLLMEKGAADVRPDVGPGAEVLSGADRAELAPARDAKTRWIGGQVVGAMAALAAFVTVFVVASTFAFAVARRRREFGLLRTVGATPRQLRRMLYGEAVAVGAAAAGAGVLLGAVFAPALGGVLVDAGFQPEGFTVRLSVPVLAATFGAGVAVAFAGVWSASRRAARIGPLDALREAAVDDRPMTGGRRWTGIAFTAVGLGAAVATGTADPADMITFALVTAAGLITGVTLLVPALVPPLVRALSWPLARRAGATGLLVREGMLTAVRRTASTVAPVLATVGFVVLITGNTQTSAHSYRTQDTVSVRASGVVVPDGTPGITDADAARVKGSAPLPTVLYGRSPLQAAGIEPAAFQDVQSGLKTVAGSLDRLSDPDGLAVSESALRALDARQGGTVPVTFEDGRSARLRVVAVVSDQSAPYEALLSRGTVRAHDPSALADAVQRTGAPHPVPGTREISVAAHAGSDQAEEDRLVEVFTLLLVGLSAGYTGLAVGNTLLMATADRLPDLRILRLSGATARQVLWVVAGETVFVVGLGTVLGGLVALPSLLGIRAGLSGTLGVPVELIVPWVPALGAIGGCLTLALVASVVPVRFALRGGSGGART
ncbi:ABC transporter permease [Streptomyces kanamyceticus]|uniref:ABC transporter permease n=2 Tax=Streptomyces kanamyceticus TaxID=1967 RepID=A0A5J6GSB5_STRKN|nr:ABC transporter permease [Streptomyces kanamyceticus]